MSPHGDAACWIREQYYDPWRVVQAEEADIADAWRAASHEQPADTSWIPDLIRRAQQVITLFGGPEQIPYPLLQSHLQRVQERLRTEQAQVEHLRVKLVRPLYRHIYPQRYVESMRGVGQDSAAVPVAFVGGILRFPSLHDFRGWSSMIPFSRQSVEGQAKGLRITKAGPSLVKTTAFIDAQVARQWDSQIAAVYHKQMMAYGKHHLQAICACATHLLDRIYVVLREHRPYELCDTDGTLVDKHLA